MAKVNKTNLTTSTILDRPDTETVDDTDFMVLAKTDKDYKISATNLILGLLKLSVPEDFNTANTPLNKHFTNVAGQEHFINIKDCHNKKITVYSDVNIQPNDGATFSLRPDYTGLPEGELVYLYIEWNYISYGTKSNSYLMSSTFGNSYRLFITGGNVTGANNIITLAQGWYKYQGGILLPAT